MAKLIASIDSDKYHQPYCRHVRTIKDGNRIRFGSKRDAVANGYTACKVCHGR